jgi:DNA topoisomerase-1
MSRLRRSDCNTAGIARRRRGRGFEYRGPSGEHIGDPEILERIADLAIPPAWRAVWICTDPLGHLQATGLDAAGRKQYVYHERWRVHADRMKFGSMLAFGRALPRLRRRVARDLAHDPGRDASHLTPTSLTHRRVLACAVRLLDVGSFRIGSDDYAERNESYGLTTMLREHVTISDRALTFDFPAKSGRRRTQRIEDDDAVAVIAALKRRRSGSELLAYRTSAGWSKLDAEDVNTYIKQHARGSFTAKEFRTWNATVLAAAVLAGDRDESTQPASAPAVRRAMRTVSDHLGNTPAVCRASYVDPRVIDRYHAGVTIADALSDRCFEGPDLTDARVRTRIEGAVLDLLDSAKNGGRAAG